MHDLSDLTKEIIQHKSIIKDLIEQEQYKWISLI